MPPDLREKLPLPPKELAQRVVVRAENYHLSNNTTSFEINAPSPGVAVLSEANPPGDVLAYVDGKPVAILIFDHPSSYNHPPRWHARGYGLFAVNPFGLKDFEPASTETGGA